MINRSKRVSSVINCFFVIILRWEDSIALVKLHHLLHPEHELSLQAQQENLGGLPLVVVCYFLFLPFDNSAVVQFCEVPKIWLHGAISQTNLIFETDFQAFMEREGSREGLQRIRTTLQRTDAVKQSS